MSDTVAEFQNERPGNHVAWRIITNAYKLTIDQPALFVYRTVDRGDGTPTTEYLQTDGTVHGSGFGGWFADLAAVGVALIRHQTLLTTRGAAGTFTAGHQTYLARFRAADLDPDPTPPED